MGFVSLKDWRLRNIERARLSGRVKQALIPLLGLAGEDALVVNEIACSEPGCPDVETVVLVMRMGEPTRALRVRRPLDAIGPDDLSALVEEERVGREAVREGQRKRAASHPLS